MKAPSDRTRDNFETVYKVYHKAEYGFGGDTSITLAVISETGERIEGRRLGIKGYPQGKMMVQKDNVAGWEEKKFRLDEIPTAEDLEPSVDDLKAAYKRGAIDEEQLEAKIGESLEG